MFSRRQKLKQTARISNVYYGFKKIKFLIHFLAERKYKMLEQMVSRA
jgi:hypothetical protein